MSINGLNRPQLTLRRKLWEIHWLFVLLLFVTASIGFRHAVFGSQRQP